MICKSANHYNFWYILGPIWLKKWWIHDPFFKLCTRQKNLSLKWIMNNNDSDNIIWIKLSLLPNALSVYTTSSHYTGSSSHTPPPHIHDRTSRPSSSSTSIVHLPPSPFPDIIVTVPLKRCMISASTQPFSQLYYPLFQFITT